LTGKTATASSPSWRLLSTPSASGARNMALDQALLDNASRAGFIPTMRFYSWSPAALSIGRFQPADDVDLEVCTAEGIDVVRRPTGGKSILHLDDFTYSIVIPPSYPMPDSVVEAYRIICGGILRALELLGIDASILVRRGDDYRSAGGACFAASTQADLEYAGRKLCGSAQVRRRGALLQHGSILLKDHSELLFKLLRFGDVKDREGHLRDFRSRCMSLDETGHPCSWSEMADAFRHGFADAFQARLEEGGLSTEEDRRWEDLTESYLSRQWLYNPGSRPFPR
jgi:lipoyl(octanoyl) transferase